MINQFQQCIVPPSVRRANIAGMHKAVCLSDGNNNLIVETGIAVDNVGMEVCVILTVKLTTELCRCLLEFCNLLRSNTVVETFQMAVRCGELLRALSVFSPHFPSFLSFPFQKYLIPAVISKWAIYYVPFQSGSVHREETRTASQLSERDIRRVCRL